jgi:hypothetical protein
VIPQSFAAEPAADIGRENPDFLLLEPKHLRQCPGVHHYGRDEFLQRLSHPFWFQSFGAVMGMDWHSSGITTSVIGALKRGLQPLYWASMSAAAGDSIRGRRRPN